MTTVVAQSASVTGSKDMTTNQIHPSPTMQQQLRTKMVVLGFSALDALRLEQNMVQLQTLVQNRPGHQPVITQGATRIYGCAKLRYPDFLDVKVEIPGSL